MMRKLLLLIGIAVIFNTPFAYGQDIIESLTKAMTGGEIFNTSFSQGPTLLGKIPQPKEFRQLTISGDGKYIAYVVPAKEKYDENWYSKEVMMRVLNVSNGQVVSEAKMKKIDHIVVAPTGDLYFIDYYDQVCQMKLDSKLFRIADLMPIFRTAMNNIFDLLISDDGRYLVALESTHYYVLGEHSDKISDIILTNDIAANLQYKQDHVREIKEYELNGIRAIQLSQYPYMDQIESVVDNYYRSKKEKSKDYDNKLFIFSKIFDNRQIELGKQLFFLSHEILDSQKFNVSNYSLKCISN